MEYNKVEMLLEGAVEDGIASKRSFPHEVVLLVFNSKMRAAHKEIVCSVVP
jgi:hypothetical protein